jgi:hypothetical protein
VSQVDLRIPCHRDILLVRLVNDVLLANLSFHICGLAFLRLHDRNVLRDPDLLYRLRLRLPA